MLKPLIIGAMALTLAATGAPKQAQADDDAVVKGLIFGAIVGAAVAAAADDDGYRHRHYHHGYAYPRPYPRHRHYVYYRRDYDPDAYHHRAHDRYAAAHWRIAREIRADRRHIRRLRRADRRLTRWERRHDRRHYYDGYHWGR